VILLQFPAQKGDAFNLTNTPGVHEVSPAWSPDGKNIAYFSDASGEYALHIKNQDGSGDVKIISLNGSGFYSSIYWSPDAKKLCFVDNGRRLYLLDVASSNIKKLQRILITHRVLSERCLVVGRPIINMLLIQL
jgi:tricorn protease